jgi:hypothetical protein
VFLLVFSTTRTLGILVVPAALLRFRLMRMTMIMMIKPSNPPAQLKSHGLEFVPAQHQSQTGVDVLVTFRTIAQTHCLA